MADITGRILLLLIGIVTASKTLILLVFRRFARSRSSF